MMGVAMRLAAVAALLCAWSSGAFAQGVSDVTFPTSGAAAAQATFVDGLTWLHSFEYEQALEAFRRAQQVDSRFAMAYWGEAMCYHQFLWLNEDVAAGRRALARIPAGAEAAVTERERQYLAAARALFGEGSRATRVDAYAAAMQRVAADHPDDPEAAAFHGLARLALTHRGLIDPGHDAGNEHPALVGSGTQREVAAIFERVLLDHPRHPGALHYLIHTYDDPAHAELALPAARLYPEVAPEASHALHMPAHIFLQLGMWADASASDEASYRASEAWMRRRNLPITVADYHSLSWLTYEYLQQGRYANAARTLDIIGRAASAEGDETRLKTLAATMQARVAVEAELWHHAAGPQYRNVDELFAVGLGAAAGGTLASAEQARQRLADMAVRQDEGPRQIVLRLMERQVAAAMRLRESRGDEAVTIMRQALALDGRLPPPMGPPQPIKPAPEMLGEILLALGRPDEAAAQFEAALSRWRNRSRSVLGLARAEALAGRRDSARVHYARFLENWRGADADRAELNEVREFLAGAATTTAPQWAQMAMMAAGVVTTLAILLTRRRRRQIARPNQQQKGRPEGRPRRAKVSEPRAERPRPRAR